jgi:hypothetical protein
MKDWKGNKKSVFATLGASSHSDSERQNEDLYDVPSYKGRLKITKDGKVYSLITNKFLKTSILPSGYKALIIMLKNPRKTKTLYLHRLIAETFIFNPLSKKTVNHINGIKTDNRIENLEWATQSENNKHAIDLGLRKINTIGFANYNKNKRVLSDSDVKFIKNNSHLSTKELCEILNVKNKYAVYDCKTDKSFKRYL